MQNAGLGCPAALAAPGKMTTNFKGQTEQTPLLEAIQEVLLNNGSVDAKLEGEYHNSRSEVFNATHMCQTGIDIFGFGWDTEVFAHQRSWAPAFGKALYDVMIAPTYRMSHRSDPSPGSQTKGFPSYAPLRTALRESRTRCDKKRRVRGKALRFGARGGGPDRLECSSASHANPDMDNVKCQPRQPSPESTWARQKNE